MYMAQREKRETATCSNGGRRSTFVLPSELSWILHCCPLRDLRRETVLLLDVM